MLVVSKQELLVLLKEMGQLHSKLLYPGSKSTERKNVLLAGVVANHVILLQQMISSDAIDDRVVDMIHTSTEDGHAAIQAIMSSTDVNVLNLLDSYTDRRNWLRYGYLRHKMLELFESSEEVEISSEEKPEEANNSDSKMTVSQMIHSDDKELGKRKQKVDTDVTNKINSMLEAEPKNKPSKDK